jgi:SAM-dependent methyltransferase
MQSDQFQLHGDIELRHWWFVARRQIIGDLIRRLLPVHEDGTQSMIVDVGCGTGANVAALADDYRCLGIDTSEEAVQLAGQRFPAVEFRHGFAPDDLADCIEDADLIMLNDVLEHVPDDFELLSKLLAAARPGTRFLLTVPADLALWSVHDESFGHYRRYDLDRFARIWHGLPVEPLLLSYFNSRLYPLVRTIRTWNRWRGQSSGRVGTDFAMPSRATNRALTSLFSGERHRLGRMLESGQGRAYRRGVSLIAILERQEGDIPIRSKPDDVAADYFDPQLAEPDDSPALAVIDVAESTPAEVAH